MDQETAETPGYLLVTNFCRSKFSEKAVTRIPAHSFPKVKILVSQKIFNHFQEFSKEC